MRVAVTQGGAAEVGRMLGKVVRHSVRRSVGIIVSRAGGQPSQEGPSIYPQEILFLPWLRRWERALGMYPTRKSILEMHWAHTFYCQTI